MTRLIGPIRLRLLVLTSLIIFTGYTAMPQQAVRACITCVELTGGLCVGCDPNVTTGYKWCSPNQSDCSCIAWDSCSQQGN